MSQHRRAMGTTPHPVDLLLLALVMVLSACARKTPPRKTQDRPSGVTPKAPAHPRPTTRRPPPPRLTIKPTAPAPTPKDLIALFSTKASTPTAVASKTPSKAVPSQAQRKGRGLHEPKVSLLRRPTAIGGARYIVVVGQPGAVAKDGARGLEIRAAIVEKVGPRWQLRGALTLPTEGAHVLAAARRSAKAGPRDPKAVRAGLRLRDVDGDGRPEAIVRYRYPTAVDVRENYVILNLDVPPTRAFLTTLTLIDPATGKPKQFSRLSFADANHDGKPELRLITRGGGKTMTTLYTYDAKADRFVAADRGRRRVVKPPRESTVRPRTQGSK